MRVYLTGGLRIETADGVVNHTAFDVAHAELVLAFLVCERGRPVATTEISELLAQAGSLSVEPSQLVAHLTASLSALVPASALTQGFATIELSLPTNTWVDVEAAADALHEAEAALRADRAADAFGPSAVAHHIARRPFLPGQRGPWVDTHRERLRGILIRALEVRGKVFLWNTESALAVEAAREVVKLEPYRETGHQLLVRALAASGNTAEALQAYQRCRQLLRDGLGIEPSAQTRNVFESIAPAPAPADDSNHQHLTPARDLDPQRWDLPVLIQRRLGADYTIERELTGGMSKVFVATERSLGRRVVIKVLPPALAERVGAERFMREIRLTARLQHPNIVPVLSAGILEGGLPYYTMPFVSGESLRATLSTGQPLSVARVTTILRDVARALAFAHKEGIIHRDVKPENILLAADSAVVTDFGIAKAVSDSDERTTSVHHALTTIGTSIGTPSYMAPEQITADPSIDHRADIYSFGVVAYELLAGRVPFADLSVRESLVSQLIEAPRPVQQLRADTPARLSALVMRCLEIVQGARPQGMLEIVAALEAGN